MKELGECCLVENFGYFEAVVRSLIYVWSRDHVFPLADCFFEISGNDDEK